MGNAPRGDLPASLGQEQLWFIDSFHHGLPAHNLPRLLRLHGPLDTAALGRALNGLVARHEVLRTRLVPDADGRPVQRVDPPAALPLRATDDVDAEVARPFAVADEWPLRAFLTRITATGHTLLLVAHRTAVDDASLALLLNELPARYAAEVAGRPMAPAGDPVPFTGHAARERERLRAGELAAAERYWRDTLAGFETVQLPTDRPRPLLASHDGALVSRSTGLAAGIRELAARTGTDLPVVILAGLYAVLSRWTGQTDLIVGIEGPNRDRPELASLVGPLANPLPVRVDLSGDPAFTGLLGRVRDTVAAAHAHQELPFARMVETVPVERDTGRAPVFQIGYQHREAAGDTEAAGVRFRCEHVARPGARYDLNVTTGDGPDGLWFEVGYPPALFDADTAGRLLGHLEMLLAGAVADPSARLSALPLLTGAERHRELVEWNDTAADFPSLCIHRGFELQAAATPDAVAAEFEGERVSYAELDRRANRIAHRLRARGVGPETLVGVCLTASIRRLAALLAVWKAGGGYVPLDPALPAERLAFLMSDTGMAVVVTDRDGAAGLPAGGAAVLDLDSEPDAAGDAGPPEVDVRPSHVAYVIYTSGSTGQPKGVVVEHRQALNFLQGMVRHWRIGPDDAVLGFAAFTFDVSVMDMFMPLIAGARVVLARADTLHSPPRLAALIRDRGVTFACLPPAVLTLLAGEHFPDLRLLLSAGEELSSELLRSWLRPGLSIYNGYGPTEASIGATFMPLTADTPLPPPIGRPKPNYRVYVLDPHLNPVPVGVIGELHIGGPGVARGYLNRPDLTGQRFIPDPFGPGRLYKTGDLVRRRADGTIVFVGRADDQVKIRGLRVEPGEIESALAGHPAVAQAVVTVVTDPAGERQLAGWLRPADGAAPDPAGLRAYLADRLPAYLVPGYLTVLDELPLTVHGKVDRAALPSPRPVRPAVAAEPPETLAEAVLVDLYAAVMGTERIGVTDGFFDAGGSSLQAMQLVTRVRAALDIDLDVAAVFLAPTSRQLAAVLRDRHGFTDEPLDAADLAALSGVD